MRVSSYSYVVIAAIAGGAVAQDTTTESSCPKQFYNQDALLFNSTNIASLADCTKLNYACRTTAAPFYEMRRYDSTTGPAPNNCTEFLRNVFVQKGVNGSLSIPGVVTISQAAFRGQWSINRLSDNPTPEYPLNVTDLELPDLVNITTSGGSGIFAIEYADKIKSVKVPKLEQASKINFNLSGVSPPAISLSFPSLRRVNSIFLIGNIDAVDLPALDYMRQINITSIGNLDCVGLAAQVVSSTPTYGIRNNDSVICFSKKSNITTYNMSQPKKTGIGRKLGVSGALVVLGFVGCLGFAL
ncbi:uncharacterized protein BP5553_06618 [Venustampulla echinocandica]|uniref:Uncharacterized protein n=1 Tax=Venustampulla echinocandica TaxID=2656787 RepID=A0A370TKF7_9HELO|nr:uncharacterized protein BP5553_06618 [Venustampulla echinocandica]RDL36006.1 hypothetical protein BP5553_06618 [Venustampulla echinocandica]